MKKKVLLIALILVLAFGVWVIWRVFAFPNLDNIKSAIPDSELSYPETYLSLIEKDNNLKLNFLIDEANHCDLIDNQFPFNRKRFNKNKTHRILMILNDSSSYQWGELGTPYHDKTIVYYDKNESPIGFTNIDLGGEVDNHPNRGIMKWGLLNNQGFNKLLREIN